MPLPQPRDRLDTLADWGVSLHGFVRLCLNVSIFALAVCAAPVTLRAAIGPALADYDFVVDVLREDYAGFPTKTDGERGAQFEALVRQHRARIERDPDAAATEIRALLGWFRDRHLGLSGPPTAKATRAAQRAQVPAQARPLPPDEFFLRRLSPETLWLRLPDFGAEHRTEIEALLERNDAALRSTPNLIVDIRENGGGADSSYEKLMGYLNTRPIYSIGVEVRDTPRNLAYYEAAASNADLPADTRTVVVDLVDRLRTSNGEWVPFFERGFAIQTYPEVLPFPKRVGIIATGAASAGDQFAIDARFSRKVTFFGGPTAGAIDFSNVTEAPWPSNPDYQLRWPTTRSQRLLEEPLDNIGVRPDVPFGREVEDPVIAAQAWLESQSR